MYTQPKNMYLENISIKHDDQNIVACIHQKRGKILYTSFPPPQMSPMRDEN